MNQSITVLSRGDVHYQLTCQNMFLTDVASLCTGSLAMLCGSVVCCCEQGAFGAEDVCINRSPFYSCLSACSPWSAPERRTRASSQTSPPSTSSLRRNYKKPPRKHSQLPFRGCFTALMKHDAHTQCTVPHFGDGEGWEGVCGGLGWCM